jgi:protoporphyrinogen/coproporphyrinogen III oxidase
LGYTEKVAVIGAGISGLACAYRLKQLGTRCFVLESTARAGGLIASNRSNGFLIETGPQCPRFPESVWRLVLALNLQDEFVGGDRKAKRYILRDGRLFPAPFSPAGLITTPLLGRSSKLRMLTEFFRHSQAPDHEESLAEFVKRKFGTEVLDNLVDPLISTVFLGDADKMGMESAFPALVEWERNQGSLVRGGIRAWKAKRNATSPKNPSPQSRPIGNYGTLRVTDALPSLGTFKLGMAALPEKLAEELRENIRFNVAVSCLSRLEAGTDKQNTIWQISLSTGEKITAESVVLAVPAYVAGHLLQQSAPEIASQLEAIAYAPLCVVSSGYDRSQVAHSLNGFGFMVPRRERLQTICTFWNSFLFPNRAPEGKVLMTSFARGIDRDCANTVEAENAKTLGITGPVVERTVWKDPRALPQYNVGHAGLVAKIERVLRTIPNLRLVGNFLRGRSIGDCVDSAFRVAEDLHSQFQGAEI